MSPQLLIEFELLRRTTNRVVVVSDGNGLLGVFGSRAGEVVVGGLGGASGCGVLAVSAVDAGSPIESFDALDGVLASASRSGRITLQRLPSAAG